MFVKFICSAHLFFLYAFFYKPCLFKTDFEQAQKPLLCRNTVVPTSSSLCVLKRCKPFFLSHGPLTSTRKAIKYNFFIIVLLYFSVRHSKSTKFLHLVHNEIRGRQDSTVLAAVRTAGASTVCKVVRKLSVANKSSEIFRFYSQSMSRVTA